MQNNEPAFPGVQYISMHGDKNPEGMTLRDYFAAKAMQAIITNHKLEDCDDNVAEAEPVEGEELRVES